MTSTTNNATGTLAEGTGADALRVLAAALMPYLREIFVDEAGAAQLVDVAKFLPLPRRTVHSACRLR
jgi:hypothetical protein